MKASIGSESAVLKGATGALCADVDLPNFLLRGLFDLDHPIDTLGV